MACVPETFPRPKLYCCLESSKPILECSLVLTEALTETFVPRALTDSFPIGCSLLNLWCPYSLVNSFVGNPSSAPKVISPIWLLNPTKGIGFRLPRVSLS